MKHISRYIMTLVALLTMTTGAWADNTVYTSGQSVRIVDLKVGDIILPGATVTRDGMSTPSIQSLKFRRCTTEWVDMSQSLPVTFDENAGLGDYHVGGKPLQPIDENGNVGNAWQVAVLTLEPFGYIATLDGITYRDPNAPVISEDGTEAEFEMPAYDATLEYDIVRNLASNMTLNLFIGTDPVTADTRLRIAKNKQTGAYLPVDQLACTLYDQTEQKTLDPEQIIAAGITPQFYLKGEDDTWTLVTDINQQTKLPNNIAVGQTYRMVLKANDDSPNYGGETAPTYAVTLFEGYEVTVPAQEYITYYRTDDALKLDDDETEAKLYTITAVNETEATATATQFDVIPQNIPMLVYNGSTEEKTILLIPTETPASFMYYAGFKGTTEATTIPASGDSSNNYAFNGKQFVWVKDAVSIAANRAWLEVQSVGIPGAPALTIVFDKTTGVSEELRVKSEELDTATWYTLSGRKLQGKPQQKGIYIVNGKKVVVK